MVMISLTVPVQVDIAVVRIACAIDDYMTFVLKDAAGNELAELEEAAPEFLVAPACAREQLTLEIDAGTGAIRGWTAPGDRDLEHAMPGGGGATRLAIFSKVRDGFSYWLLDASRAVVAEQREDYVPGFMPGDHYGDYVILDIDLATGRIAGWQESCTPKRLHEASEGQYVTRYWPPRAAE